MTTNLCRNKWRLESRQIRSAFAIVFLSLGALESLCAQEPNPSALPAATGPNQSPQVASEPLVPPTTPEEAQRLMFRLYPAPPESTPAPSPETNSQQRPWKFTLSGKVSAVYDSNIFIAPENAKSDFLFTFSPGATFAYGDYRQREENFIILDYDLGVIRFARHIEEDAIEQQASLAAHIHFARLTVGLTFRFQDLSGPDVDAGARTKRRLYETIVFNKYEISDKTYAELDFQNNIFDYETRLDSVESLGRIWWNYRWSPNTTFGGGLSGGVLEVQDSATQTYEQALGRVIYAATEKLSFNADGGIELRQTDETARATPVFSLTATYFPFEATQIQLNAHRRVQNSAVFVGEDYSASGAKIEIRHTWRGNCDFILAGGYEHSEYHAFSGNGGSLRQDDCFLVRPAVEFKLASWAQALLFYEYRHNDSTLERFSFQDSQIGIQLAFAY